MRRINAWWFGAPWMTSYQRVLVREVGSDGRRVARRASSRAPARGRGPACFLGRRRAFPRAYQIFGPGLLGFLALIGRKDLRVGSAEAPRSRNLIVVGCSCFLTRCRHLLLMKYQWYRPYFLYPAFGASALGLAANRRAPLRTAAGGEAGADSVSRYGSPSLPSFLVSGVACRIALRRDPRNRQLAAMPPCADRYRIADVRDGVENGDGQQGARQVQGRGRAFGTQDPPQSADARDVKAAKLSHLVLEAAIDGIR